METTLKKSKLAFATDEYYKELFKKLDEFLDRSGKSEIRPHMDKIELYYTVPN